MTLATGGESSEGDTRRLSVFSTDRVSEPPSFPLPPALTCNTRLKMDGLHFLGELPSGAIAAAFFYKE